MSAYQLASIPKFDKKHRAIAKAAKAREWRNLIAQFDNLPTSEQACVLGKVSELIFVEGFTCGTIPRRRCGKSPECFQGMACHLDEAWVLVQAEAFK